jgi:hypothetical protein
MTSCCKTENGIMCKYSSKYGDYCYKHRREYLIVNDLISVQRFTGKCSDYLKSDISIFRERVMMVKGPDPGNKCELFKVVNDDIVGYADLSSLDIRGLILIQSIFRGYICRRKCIPQKCNNDEDFYTYDLLKYLEPAYFYSYVDKMNIRWGFDIRSLMKLIQMGYNNPYTTEVIPDNIINEVKRKVNEMKAAGIYEDLTDTIIRDRVATIKQNSVDLFSFIEQSGYTCQIEWFTALSLRRLKELYKHLEDIWNYRSEISHEMKCNICPPLGIIFKTPMIEVINYTMKEDLQELILKEVFKFTHAESDSDRKLGFMYFLISLGYVSLPCYLSHIDWLGHIIPPSH